MTRFRALLNRRRHRQPDDAGIAMVSAVMAMTVLTFLSAAVVMSAGVNEINSARARGSATGRSVAYAALDDFFARMLINPHLITDMIATPASYTSIGYSPLPSSPNLVQFDNDGRIVTCTGLTATCWYLEVANNSSVSGGLVAQQQSVVAVTVRSACRATAASCRTMRFQQTLRRRQFFDYVLFQDRESVSGTIVPPTQQGTACTDALLLQTAAVRDATSNGCLQVPFLGSVASGPTGAGGAAQDRMVGPLHTNDSWIYHCGNPYFSNNGSGLPAAEATAVDYVSPGGRRTFACNAAGTPTFDGGYSGGAPTLTYPLTGQLASISAPVNPGNAVRFDGIDDRIAFSNGNAAQTSAANAATVELWFEAERVTGRQVLYEEGGTGNGLNLYLDNDYLYATAWANDGTTWWLRTSTRIQNDTPYHAVAVLDATSGRLTLFLNGVVVATDTTATATAFPARTNAASLAATSDGTRYHDGITATTNTGWFKGRIDEVARYSTLLTDTRILAHYQGRSLSATSYAANVNTDTPALYYRLDEPAGSTTAAATGNGDGNTNGTYTGPPTLAAAPLAALGATSTSPTQACSTAAAQTLGNLKAIAPSTHRFVGPVTLTLNGTQIIKDGNTGTPLRLPTTGVIFINGDLTLSGTVTGKLTIYATGRVRIAGDLTYGSGELSGYTNGVLNGVDANATSALGVIACKDLNIAWASSDGASAGRNLTGVFMSITDSVWSDGWNSATFTTPNPPKLTIHGAVISKFRVITNSYYNTADGSGGAVRTLFRFGLEKNFRHDTRLQRSQPPYFLQPVTAGWARVDLVEVNQTS